MDQLKDILKQAVKYRFWIAIGIASLLPIIAFFVGTGALADAEKAQTTKIKSAKDEAGKFASGTIQNGLWKSAVDEKKELVGNDIARAHKKLYDIQEPLLTWPNTIVDIPLWGETYPAKIDVQKISEKILDYTFVYDKYVDDVYMTFKPFDLKTGKGIVAAPSKQALLRPVVFNELAPPSLSDVWTAQRKLWIERTMFDVVAKVNAKSKATNWDNAPIKQIVMLEVANALALDQKTAAKEGQLIDAPPIVGDPKAAAPKAAAAATTTGSSRSEGFGGGGGAAASTGPEPVQFVVATSDQYYIVPVAMSVYIEQDRIPDLLVEFRNSPMSIRVLDFEMRRPKAPVKKPQKGEESAAFSGQMGEGRGRGGMGGGLAGGGMGGDSDGGGGAMTIESMTGSQNKYNKRAAGKGPSMGGQGQDQANPKTREGGKNLAADNIKRLDEKRNNKNLGDTDKDKSKADQDEAPTISNPYFNIVQVTIRGQARFYKPPVKPATPVPATTPGNATPETPKDAPKPDAPKTDATTADVPKADAAKADVPKADAAKADMPKDAVKPDAPKTDPAVPKTDVPKADKPKDAVKPDAPKPDVPKADAPKTDAPNPDAPKTKTDGEKPKS